MILKDALYVKLDSIEIKEDLNGDLAKLPLKEECGFAVLPLEILGMSQRELHMLPPAPVLMLKPEQDLDQDGPGRGPWKVSDFKYSEFDNRVSFYVHLADGKVPLGTVYFSGIPLNAPPAAPTNQVQ